MKKPFAQVLILIFILLSLSNNASATSCYCSETGLVENFAEASIVFSGEVVKINNKGQWDQTVTLDVIDGFKGVNDSQIIIYESDCDYTIFEEGERYLVYAIEYHGKYFPTSCGRTSKLEATSDVKALRETREPGWNFDSWKQKYKHIKSQFQGL